MGVSVPRAIGLYLSWLAFISAVLLAVVGDVLPMRLASLPPEDVFTALIEAELFFVLVVWPLVIPRLFVPKPAGAISGSPILMGQVLVLLATAMPLALLCRELSGTELPAFLKGHLVVATAASFVAALFGGDPARVARVTPWYFVAFFVLAAALPFMHYLALEYSGTSLRFLSGMSPFWGVAQLDGGAPIGCAAILGVGALGVFLAAPFVRRTSIR